MAEIQFNSEINDNQNDITKQKFTDCKYNINSFN